MVLLDAGEEKGGVGCQNGNNGGDNVKFPTLSQKTRQGRATHQAFSDNRTGPLKQSLDGHPRDLG
jgi:hypothetical protein